MLKLSQINLQNSNTFLAEILEPIVYKEIGSVIKSDAVIARDKETAPLLVAKVLQLPKNFITDKDIKVGTHVIISKNSNYHGITFPIKGYDSPVVAIISDYSVEAVINED